MADESKILPDDPDLLKEIIGEQRRQLEANRRQIEQLQRELDQLARRLFGRSSEKLDPNQLQLVFHTLIQLGEPTPPPEEKSAETERKTSRRRRSGGRRRLPKDLPRERIEYRPKGEELRCEGCGDERVCIGEETSEQLEYKPASFRIIEHAELKFACPHCEDGVWKGKKDPQLIPKGIPGPGLLAHIVVSKYADHLPLNRQEGILARHGIKISRSTMMDWVASAAGLADPVIQHLKMDLLLSERIHTDETPILALEPRGGSHKGRLWVYVGDPDHPSILFDYTPTRERDGPTRFLAGFRGYLQADAYAGYDGIYAGGEIREVACWAHARRYVFDALSSSEVAYAAMGFVRRLYKVEHKARKFSFADRYALRQEESVPGRSLNLPSSRTSLSHNWGMRQLV